jgi:FMN phosphatase YigB (HAD superfamily)
MRRPLELQSPVRHLLVDLDGTLLGARELPLRLDFVTKSVASIRRLRRGAGSWMASVRALWAVQTEMERRPIAEGSETNDRRAAAVFARTLGIPLSQGEEILRESMGQLFPTLSRHFFPMPGAQEFLTWARGHYPLTLATNPVWPIEMVKLRLDWAGIDPAIFGDITHAGVMHATKPSLEYYREVLSRVSGSGLKPGDFLLIGNDVRQDLPAVRAGIPVFIVTPPRRRKSRRGAHPERPVAFATGKGEAPAWRGPFSALKAMLEKNQGSL